jgi:hypothetical protein
MGYHLQQFLRVRSVAGGLFNTLFIQSSDFMLTSTPFTTIKSKRLANFIHHDVVTWADYVIALFCEVRHEVRPAFLTVQNITGNLNSWSALFQ